MNENACVLKMKLIRTVNLKTHSHLSQRSVDSAVDGCVAPQRQKNSYICIDVVHCEIRRLLRRVSMSLKDIDRLGRLTETLRKVRLLVKILVFAFKVTDHCLMS